MIDLIENESNMSLITTPNYGGSYCFLSKIPADLREHFGGLVEFRVSLNLLLNLVPSEHQNN